MDKEKIIEEMAKVTCGYKVSCNRCKKVSPTECADRYFARTFYDAGYRKVPEDAVVLTKEEYEKLQRQLDFYLMRIRQYEQEETERNILAFKKLEGERTLLKKDEIEAIKEQARQERTKEIFSRIEAKKDAMRHKTDTYRFASLNGEILRLEKEFGFVKEEELKGDKNV